MKKWQGTVLQQADAAVSAFCAGNGWACRFCHSTKPHRNVQTYPLCHRQRAAQSVICGNTGNTGHSLTRSGYRTNPSHRRNGHRKGNIHTLCTHLITTGICLTKNIGFKYFVAPQCWSLISWKLQSLTGLHDIYMLPLLFLWKGAFLSRNSVLKYS